MKKIEAEAVIQQYQPDLFAISESNILLNLPDHEKAIPGYQLHLPKSDDNLKMARLALYVKEGVQMTVLNQLIDAEVAAIWVKLGAKGRKPMTLGFVYREFQYIMEDHPSNSIIPQKKTRKMDQICHSLEESSK